MIMLVITVTVLVAISVSVIVFTSRYWLTSIAKTHFITAELSPEFHEQFAKELALCTVSCKKFVGEKNVSVMTGPDDRPIISAAGELLINEERCKHLSSEVFSAGLEYEQAHIKCHYYLATFFVSLGIIAITMSLISFISGALNGFIAIYRTPLITNIARMLAAIFNFFNTWVIAQVPVIFWLSAWSEYIVAHVIVKSLVNHGRFSAGLLEYLEYQESYVTPAINETFNISSNRKYLEKLLEKQKSE